MLCKLCFMHFHMNVFVELFALCSGPEDFNDHVISNGSFSKLVGPGVRLGWLEMSKSLVSRMTT